MRVMNVDLAGSSADSRESGSKRRVHGLNTVPGIHQKTALRVRLTYSIVHTGENVYFVTEYKTMFRECSNRFVVLICTSVPEDELREEQCIQNQSFF